MLEKANEIYVLLKKYNRGAISDSESRELQQLLEGSEAYQKLFDGFKNQEIFDKNFKIYVEESAKLSDEDLRRIFDKSLNEAKIRHLPFFKRTYRWLAAASIALLIAVVTYFSFRPGDRQNEVAGLLPVVTNDVAPGSYKAKLTLADGSVVVLDSAAGELAKQGNVSVKNENGQLVYNAQGKNTKVLYNTLSTSNGESYSTLLADGSRIWLNSGSSVKYPVAFGGDERVIEASGEIFLEVAKDAKLPFKVQVLQDAVKRCEVQVLGTSFNVMAYPDESQIETTLIEGKIAFATGSMKKLLVPGQQIALNSQDNVEVSNDVNTDMITAWKNQDFYFKSNDLKTIMRHLARWYGIEVQYEGKTTNERFTGQISRNKNLSEVLRMIEQSGVSFKIEGKKVTVKLD